MKTLKTILLYFLMVVLIFFLFLPPVLRALKDDEGEEVEEKETFVALNCVRDKETLDMNYLGKNLQSLFYRVPGDKSGLSNDTIKTEENDIIRDIFPVAMLSYSESEDITRFSIKYTLYELNYETMKNYTLNIDQQKNYLTKKGFTCTKTEF